MAPVHIITMAVISILFFGLCAVLSVHRKNSVVPGSGDDFITKFVKSREERIGRAGIMFPVSWYMRILVAAPAILAVLGWFATGSGIATVLFAVVGLLVPELIVRVMEQQAAKKFEERYARSLEQLGSCLRAGMSIMQAVDDVAACRFIHPAIRRKYMTLSSMLKMGVPVSTAFYRFAEGTGNPDAEDVALAIDIQNEVGGREAEAVKAIASNIHDRIMLRKEIKSMFAGSSTMVYAFDILPFIIILWFSVANESYTEVYLSNGLYTVLFIFFIFLFIIGSVLTHRALYKTKRQV